HYYRATLKWLPALARVLPLESSGILEKIGKYNQGELEDPNLESVRYEGYYLLGRYYYAQGSLNPQNFKQAIDLFARVPLESEVFVRAKFFEGITRVRQGDGKGAAEAF